MNLNRRIARLERTLGERPCTCENSADLAYPGHTPYERCLHCHGKRIIYTFEHHPKTALPLLQQAVPLMAKADANGERNLANLTDRELRQLRAAMQLYESHAP
jgi:hypothetical protein